MAGSYLVPMELPRLDAALTDAGSATAEVRWVAALALGQEDGPRVGDAVEALARLAADPVEEVRAQALEGLAWHARAGRNSPVATLAEALTDRSDLVRMTAVEAVELFADDPVAEVARMLDDEAPGVRIAAARVLADLGAGADRLTPLLDDADRVVRREAGVALARLGDTRGIGPATEALRGGDPEAVEAALALGRLGSTAAVPALRQAIGGWLRPAELKAAAAAALVLCSDPEGLEAIGRLLGALRGSTRMAALSVLARLPVPGVASRVGALLDRGGSLEASSALRALVALGEVDRRAALTEISRRRGALTGELAEELEEALAALGGTER